MTLSLIREFETLCESKQATKRGRRFEELFCRLLYKNSFDVHKNPRSANPRQTDIFAENGDVSFLFELKWLKRRVDIAAIAQIRDRLRRVTRGTIGCICSMSGFTETLIQEIEKDRHEYEVLLFDPFEVYSLFAEEVTVRGLVDEKRRSMRTGGIVWFLGQGPRSTPHRYTELPESTEQLDLSQKSVHFRLTGKDISDLVFVSMPLIFDEYLWAFNLRVNLRETTIDGIKQVFTAATNYLSLRGGGRFGIRQRQSGWYGLGSDNFIKELGRHAERYKGYKGEIHHSEELVFCEALNQGLFLLNARQRLSGHREIHSAEVTIRLRGMPIDAEPYIKFSQTVGQNNVLFTPVESLERSAVALLRWIRINPSDVITKIQQVRVNELGTVGISGLVIKNPFFQKETKIAKLSNAEVMAQFAESEYLICTLDDWLEVGDEVDQYVLTDLEAVATGGTVLLRPRCTWRKLTKRVDPNEKKNQFKEIEFEFERRERLLERIKRASNRRKSN